MDLVVQLAGLAALAGPSAWLRLARWASVVGAIAVPLPAPIAGALKEQGWQEESGVGQALQDAWSVLEATSMRPEEQGSHMLLKKNVP